MSRYALPFLLLTACAPEPGDTEGVVACAETDDDGDGLTGCEEEELGLDPALADSDGDGSADGEELDCLSDPLDGDEACYACGWQRNDPGTLQSTGNQEGDTIANLSLVDQCRDTVDLWDFAGEWHLAFMTTEWCGACLAEAKELEAWGKEYRQETGVDFSYLVILFEDVQGDQPKGGTAVNYADVIDARKLPVLADKQQAILSDTPYDGSRLPGKCLLSPEMEMVECWDGHAGIEELFEVMARHAE